MLAQIAVSLCHQCQVLATSCHAAVVIKIQVPMIACTCNLSEVIGVHFLQFCFTRFLKKLQASNSRVVELEKKLDKMQEKPSAFQTSSHQKTVPSQEVRVSQ